MRSLPYNENFGAAERLIVAAEPVLRSLAESLAGLHAGVLLSDRNANIVRRWVADRSIAAELDRICSDCGFGAPEDRVGTNGIGTVAELGTPQIVVGPEHYADSLLGFTCVGAPIHNPSTHRLEGVVTLSCQADAANALLTPLIVGTASDIENRLLQSSTLSERCLLDAYLAAKKRHHVVIGLNRDTLMAGPRGNRALAQLTDRDHLWDIAIDRVGASASLVSLRLLNGLETTAEFSPVRVDDRLVGVIVVFDDASGTEPESSHGRPSIPSTTNPLSTMLPGESPRWQATLKAAHRYLTAQCSVVIEGPGGSGKWTLATAMASSAQATHGELTALVLDAADLDDENQRQSLGLVDQRPDILLIRHIDRMGQAGGSAVAELLDRLGAEMPWLIATRRDLDSTSDAGRRVLERFRFGGVAVPALAERAEDIPAIIESIVSQHPNGARAHLSSDAISELRRASWPAGLRQLNEVIQSLLAVRVGEISTDDLPVEVRTSAMHRNLSPIEQLECEAIIQALRDADGNKLVAAKSIGLSRSTIYRKIRAYGIDCETTFF